METSVVIPNGKDQISGTLHMPQQFSGEKLPVIVICHGFISNKIGQHQLFVKAARKFCDNGFAVLRFDYTGCGESTGEHHNITLPNQVRETLKVLNFLALQPNIDSENIILLGHSFGGGVASIVAGRARRVRKLILWSPVANPLEDIVGIVGKEIYQRSLAGKSVDYLGFELGRKFFLSLSNLLPLEKIKEFSGDVLIIHGSDDAETPLINSKYYSRALSERPLGDYEVKVIEGGDHTYASPVWEQEIIAITLNWLEAARYGKAAGI
ncbi:MAG: hypothetical protein H6Q73_3638 [Firmicutes bacterium]|nr:hypothetical protein [Bacillota bacterium]